MNTAAGRTTCGTGRLLAVALLIFAAGFVLRGCLPPRQPAAPATAHPEAAGPAVAAAEVWTCSMHPQVRKPGPGQCPLCGMALIRVTRDPGADANQPRQLTLSPAARARAEVTTAAVERRAVAVEVRLVGKVRFDETRLAYISPRVPGRIDRLYANYTGMPVQPGDHLADMYSPDLVSAQQELLQALKTTSDASDLSASLLTATRERLRLWGLTADQIAGIEQSGRIREHITFYAPIGGIVVAKDAREGQYVETGMRLFTVADLTRVWVQLEAYEADLAWLRYAQEVLFQVEAYPGETFKGTITFIAPLLDPLTRTVNVRVNVANADGRLKPEMFVRAVVHATVAGNGRVLRRDLSGKWISPMHPEIIKDGPGACDVCGMALVRAEDLGYAVADDAAGALPLVIPASAPLITGRRAVVYVALRDRENVYEGRDVVLGPRAGDYYLVVTQGAFKLDSSLQIQGNPSMMTPAADAAPADHDHGDAAPEASAVTALAAPDAFRAQVAAVLNPVLAMGNALADDNLDAAVIAAAQAQQALGAVDMNLLSAEAHVRWMTSVEALNLSLTKVTAAQEIEPFRLAFAALSSEMARVAGMFAPLRAAPLYILHCPMAFDDRGASWLQQDQAVRNPYFGKAMLTCGDVTGTIPSAGGTPP